MAVRTAKTYWEGSLTEGQGETHLVSSGAGRFEVSWAARVDEPEGKTSPEELLAAAHATCFSKSLAHELVAGRSSGAHLGGDQGGCDLRTGDGHHRDSS